MIILYSLPGFSQFRNAFFFNQSANKSEYICVFGDRELLRICMASFLTSSPNAKCATSIPFTEFIK